MYTRIIWIAAWGIVSLLSFKVDCAGLLSNRGIHIIGNEYYRFFTGLLVHVNLFHFLINAVALYWVLYFLDQKISDVRLLLFSIVAGTLANVVFSCIYPDSQSVGGSPVVFSLIAFLAVQQLLQKELPRFDFRTAYGQVIIGYAILGNIPVFSKNLSTLVIHAIAFGIAFLLGAAGIKLHIMIGP